ncbi:MAG: hypothetical protein L0170_11210 [Acidobacteria bacterium]|nr:hypothetical protein [Acidobacteriota bacterium]
MRQPSSQDKGGVAAREAPQVLLQRFRGPVAVGGVLLQAVEDDGLEVPRDSRVQTPGLHRIAFEDLTQRLLVVPSLERWPTAQGLVHRRAERIHVRAVIDVDLLPPRLLGAHVLRGAEEVP